jgi:hypothetical protein
MENFSHSIKRFSSLSMNINWNNPIISAIIECFILALSHILGLFRIADGASTLSMARSHWNKCYHFIFNQALRNSFCVEPKGMLVSSSMHDKLGRHLLYGQ